MIFPSLFNRATTPTDPVFYYSTKKDACDFNEQPFPAPNETANGSLCAYIPDTNPILLYACPAPDNVCWSPPRLCTGRNATTPGSDQIFCDNNTKSKWCCNATYESCTQTFGQINVCWGRTFANPNKGVPPVTAISIAASAISASQASALNSRLSGITATSNMTSSKPTITQDSEASGSKAGQPSRPSDSLSGGAIAGIVVGVVTAATILALIIFFFLHRQRKANIAEADANEMGRGQIQLDYYKIDQAKNLQVTSPQEPTMELQSLTMELPGSEAASELADGTR